MAVRGTIYREGRTVHLQAQLLETHTGRLLRPVERVSVSDDSLMVGIDRLRTRVRCEGLGIKPSVHAEPAFAALRRWPPLAALLAPVTR